MKITYAQHMPPPDLASGRGLPEKRIALAAATAEDVMAVLNAAP